MRKITDTAPGLRVRLFQVMSDYGFMHVRSESKRSADVWINYKNGERVEVSWGRPAKDAPLKELR